MRPIGRDVQLLFRAFEDLSSERPVVGGGMGGVVWRAIPWSMRMKWMDRHRLREPYRTTFDRVIKRMDNLYLEHANAPKGKSEGEDA